MSTFTECKITFPYEKWKSMLNSEKKTTTKTIKFKKKIAIELREKCKHKLQKTDNNCDEHVNFPQLLVMKKIPKDSCSAKNSWRYI